MRKRWREILRETERHKEKRIEEILFMIERARIKKLMKKERQRERKEGNTVKELFFPQALEERKRADDLSLRSQSELESLKVDLEGQINRIRAEYDEKVEDLEKRLEVALGEEGLTVTEHATMNASVTVLARYFLIYAQERLNRHS